MCFGVVGCFFLNLTFLHTFFCVPNGQTITVQVLLSLPMNLKVHLHLPVLQMAWLRVQVKKKIMLQVHLLKQVFCYLNYFMLIFFFNKLWILTVRLHTAPCLLCMSGVRRTCSVVTMASPISSQWEEPRDPTPEQTNKQTKQSSREGVIQQNGPR